MLAAAAGRPFAIPFSGRLNFQHAGEVADSFIRAAATELRRDFTGVYDLHGTAIDVAEIVELIGGKVSGARITASGPTLPFPAEFDDEPLRRIIGQWPRVAPATGIADTIDAFADLLRRNLVQFTD
jgi:nucleoside-diphosphate-sugar epimerase